MDAPRLIDYLRGFSFSAALSPAELELLAGVAEWHTFPKYAFVYLSDTPSETVFLLVKGAVKTGIYSPDGKEIIKRVHHPYDVFGEMGLSGETRRHEFACALGQEIHCLTVPVTSFQALLKQNVLFSQHIIDLLGDRVRRAERQWESMILKDVRSRIVEFLKESAGLRGRQVGYETMVKHGLTQQDIANIVGASRQTVTAVLNELKKSNLIYFNRNTILIRDMEKLG
jgi:CRP/FNR family cyclic AMP-dependent transcriptional regulator